MTSRAQQPAIADPDLPYMSVLDVGARLRKRHFSATELTNAILQRIEALDGGLKSYATVMRDAALADAARADAELEAGRDRGPLHGIPVAVKDLCFTRGVRTMGGTAVLADFVPTRNATVVDRLAAAGAVLLGKLNLTEGAMGRYHPSLAIPLNPWNPVVSAGSSSSGSGVAAAAGLAYATLGSDTGGSIRFPAAACGVVGLKPTWGRVSRSGVLPLAESLDHVGPLARSVADAAIVLQAIAGYDPLDPTSLRQPPPDLTACINAGVGHVRIGYDETYIAHNSHPVLATAVTQAVAVLARLGAEIVPVAFPDFDAFVPAWIEICAAEATVAHEATYPARRDEYGPGFRDWLDRGARVRGADYARAHHLRLACNARVRDLFAQVDLLAMPSTIEPPTPVTAATLYGPRPDFDSRPQRFTAPFDFNGAPTLSLPCGFTDDGLPLSLQLAAPPLRESVLCRVGHAYEQACAWQAMHPQLPFLDSADDRTG